MTTAKNTQQMHTPRCNRRRGAFTLVELLCVMAIIALLAALLLPTLDKGQARAKQIECVNNLKEAGLAFQMFMHDHSGKFPMQTPAKEGGSLDFVQSGYRIQGDFYFSFRHFQTLSNELVTPRHLVCPSDLARWPATNFSTLKNENLSYFVGVSATFASPESVLAGDRNITRNGLSPTILRPTADSILQWTEELHQYKGNLLFSDGHVAQAKNPGNEMANAHYFLPTVSLTAAATGPGGGSPGAGGPGRSGPPPGSLTGNQPPPPDPSQTNMAGAGTNAAKPKDAADGKPLASIGPTGKSISAGTPVTVFTPADISRSEKPVKPETNPAPVTVQGRPSPPPDPDSGVSPFARWFAEAAQELADWAKWILALLILLLLAAMIAMRVRYFSRRKAKLR